MDQRSCGISSSMLGLLLELDEYTEIVTSYISFCEDSHGSNCRVNHVDGIPLVEENALN